MKRCEIKLKINDYNLKTKGSINNNILSFYDKDKLKTNIIFDYKKDILTRDNDEMKLVLDFSKEEKNLEITLKKEKRTFFENLTKISLQHDGKKVIIIYRVEDIIYHLDLSYEEESP